MTGLALIFAPVSLAFNLFVIVTSPIWAAIAAILNRTELPYPLSWVHTHDDDIYGSRTTLDRVPSTVMGRFWRAVWWLCRNPGYGFDAYVLGFASAEVIDQEIRQTGILGYGYARQYVLMELTGGRKRFSFRADIPLYGDRYLKFWIGWHYLDQAGRRMFKVDFNPFKKFTS